VTPCITVVSQRTLFTTRVVYKFTFVWYSSKQGTKHRPTSHLVHLYTVRFIWLPREERRQQRSWFDDFAGRCLLWRLSSQNIFCGRTWSSSQCGGGAILALSSFLNQIPHQKESQCVYLAPHDITVSNCWVLFDRENWKSNFAFHLKVRSTHRIAVSHMIRTVNITHVLVVPFHDVRFHRVYAVVTKISFCLWWVHVSLHLNCP
jgi:hypothetical protein